MIVRIFVVALAALSLHGVASSTVRARDDLWSKIEKQNKISLDGVLNNIGPKGSRVPGAAAGAIVASPTTVDPNYFYTWTRDAALTMKMLVDEFMHGDKALQSYIQDYIKTQAVVQTVSNPSGAFASGRGLGEPKFYSNITRFNGDWGRPQRDGPALRATALITYSNWLLGTGSKSDASEAKEKVWPVIQNDLSYVAQYWNNTGFDLWEEIRGSSFFTTATQHRALVEGITLGKRLGQDTSRFESQAPNIRCFLQTYWNGKYALANKNIDVGFLERSWIDSNTVLTSIATFDPEAGCDDTLFQPCSPRALANLKVYVDAFRTIYTINKNIPAGAPVATGRYPEDIYYEGNPWYLTTLAVAEQLYDAIQQWSTINKLEVSDTDLAFWTSIYPSAKIGVYKKGQREFNKLLDTALEYADGFVKIALKYTPSTGDLAEQFSRENGTAVSARHLTWSYASFITMRSARLAATSEYPQVPSWGASSATSLPSVCRADAVRGFYKPAIAAGAPADTPLCTIIVNFNLNASTYFGENIYLTGSGADLGNWSPSDALAGSASNYTEQRPLWQFAVELPVSLKLGYKYMRKEPNGTVVYEAKNRTLSVPECPNPELFGSGETVVEDEWLGGGGNASVVKLV